MRYRDKTGRRHLESTGTTDWAEAQKQMRERLLASDDNTLDSGKGNARGQRNQH